MNTKAPTMKYGEDSSYTLLYFLHTCAINIQTIFFRCGMITTIRYFVSNDIMWYIFEGPFEDKYIEHPLNDQILPLKCVQSIP